MHVKRITVMYFDIDLFENDSSVCITSSQDFQTFQKNNIIHFGLIKYYVIIYSNSCL